MAFHQLGQLWTSLNVDRVKHYTLSILFLIEGRRVQQRGHLLSLLAYRDKICEDVTYGQSYCSAVDIGYS